MKRSGYLTARSEKSPVAKSRSKAEEDLDAMFLQAERIKAQVDDSLSSREETNSPSVERMIPRRKPRRSSPVKQDADEGGSVDAGVVVEAEGDRDGDDEEQLEQEEAEPDQDEDINDNVKSANDHLRCQFRRTAEKGIKNDLVKLNISPEVIEIADTYYEEVTKGEIKRSNLRKGIMFACVFQAYKDLNKHQTPDYLQKLFKITRRTMSKGLTYFYPRSTKRSGDNGYITAEHFIPRVMETFNVKQEHIDAALKIYDSIKDRIALFNSSNPQSVSSGVVYYYFKKINVDIPGKDFGKVVGLSEVTITRIASRIDELLSV